MGDRPGVLRALRATGGIALGAAALTIALGGAPAAAAEPKLLSHNGTDPSAAGAALAWQRPGGGRSIFLRAGTELIGLPGSDPALGPQTVVWRDGNALVVARQDDLIPMLRIDAPGAEEPAISDHWLVWRAREDGGDVLRAVDLLLPDVPAVVLLRTSGAARLGRPSVDGDRAVLHLATRRASKIIEIFLPTGKRFVLRRVTGGPLLLNPSALDGKLLYVRSSLKGQTLLLGWRRSRSGENDKRLYRTQASIRRDSGVEGRRSPHGPGYAPRGREGVRTTLWTTALAANRAYVTRISVRKRATRIEILKLRRRG